MHYLIPQLWKKIEKAQSEQEKLATDSPEYKSLQEDIDGWQEQIGDLQMEDACGINEGYQV
jgi:predicted  nucleic acid-binding Zn-ribbon protein